MIYETDMEWKHTIRKINELKPQENNPRKITKKQKAALERSIETFGIAEPICITKECVIIGGHQRYELLKSKKIQDVHCWECQEDLSIAELAELTIRLNKNHAEWDFDILANFYDTEDLFDWGFELEDLNLEEDPHSTEAPSVFNITVHFESLEHLNQGEKVIQEYLAKTDAGTYRVKIK